MNEKETRVRWLSFCIIEYGWLTYSSTQWPAVAIQFSFIMAPPHRCVLEKPKNDVLRTLTCHGYRPNGAFLPPTMRVSGRPIVERPQSGFWKEKNDRNELNVADSNVSKMCTNLKFWQPIRWIALVYLDFHLKCHLNPLAIINHSL